MDLRNKNNLKREIITSFVIKKSFIHSRIYFEANAASATQY